MTTTRPLNWVLSARDERHGQVLRLSPQAGFGFARDFDALPNTLPPEKHYGYALQWWGLAAATLVVALVLTFRRSTR